MNCSFPVWHFSRTPSVGWCCRLASISKTIDFLWHGPQKSAWRSSCKREQRRTHWLVLHCKKETNAKSNVLTACFQESRKKWHFKQLRHKYQVRFSKSFAPERMQFNEESHRWKEIFLSVCQAALTDISVEWIIPLSKLYYFFYLPHVYLFESLGC